MAASVRTYGDLPENVLDFLSSFDGIEYVGGFVGRHVSGGLPEAETNVLHLLDEVVLGKEPLSAVPGRLKEYLSIDDAAARTAAAELVAARVLPIAVLVGLDAETQLAAWGADPSSYKDVQPIRPASPEPLSASSTATSSARPADAFFSDPILQHRLELIVSSFRTGVRTREQAVAVLMRPVKTGGLEMTAEEAAQSLDLVRLPAVEPAAEPILPEPVAEPRAQPPEPSPSRPDAFTDDDAAEIQRIADEKRALIEQPSLITDTKAAAEKIVAEAKLAFASGELRTRFDHIIDARLRDVRDGFQTRAKLEAPAEQGGVGLAGTQLVAVMEAVERMDAGHHQALERQMAEKKARFASDRKEKTEQDAKILAREEQVMAKRYAEITGKAPTELVGPPTGRATAAVPAAQAVAEREQKIDAAKVRAVVEAAKANELVPPPIMSEPTIPTAPSGRPKVEDIRFERKLAGPVEELRLLNLTDFRRFSTDPAQAAGKIRERVELVSQEGYDQRIAAIKAWRSSPLSQLYVSLSREALLSGKGIRQVLEEKRASGEDVLTDAELATIVELNGVLRF